ncbi:hypothetical protein [Natronomonas gomsonensis]|uniref:DUF7344 domain-containing protein n=1 Tax=Natronomonas gomsonensis TaxID=1046043 RepID=UPI0015C1C19B|nr:hypothetical protein [Natronomonas gomsonensis]
MQLLNAIREQFDTTDAESDSPNLPPTVVYELLNNERRRRIIEYLVQYDVGEEVACSDVADHLSTLGDDRTCAYVSLTQQHAGRLDACGACAYNDREKTLRVRSEIHAVYAAHEAVEQTLD